MIYNSGHPCSWHLQIKSYDGGEHWCGQVEVLGIIHKETGVYRTQREAADAIIEYCKSVGVVPATGPILSGMIGVRDEHYQSWW